MFKQKSNNGLLKEAIRLALFASIATGATTVAPVAMAQDDGVEEVVVTGSRITRSTIQESGNLIQMDREDIDATGDLMIADVLRSSPLNSYGSFSERSGSSAQSNATIDLRGLGDSRTLVLINGHRIPGSPNLGAASVNINMIPMAAVERIEMLPDAASAVYGSDAIAGVVNIIMKKNYDGLKFSMRKGDRSQDDGGESSFSILGGASGDRGNVTFGISHDHRDAIFDADRSYTAASINGDGGDGVVDLYTDTNGISFYGKTVWLYDPTTGYDQTLAATDCPTTDGFMGAIDFTEAWAASQPSTACAYAYANISANKAELDRTNTYLDASFEINDNTEFFMNALFSRVESFGRYAPPAAKWGNTGDFPTDYPTNPFDIDALITSGDITADNYLLTGYYRWTNVGPRDNFVTDVQYDLTAGLRGDITDDVSYEFYGQYNRYDSKEQGRYYLSQLGLSYVLDQGLDPFSEEGAAAMKATVGQDNYTIMDKIYGQVQWSAGDLFDAGDVLVVAGAEQFSIKYQNLYDAASEAGLIGGSAGNSSSGDRDVTALFAEAVIPLPSDVEADLAVRYDDYSDFGSKVSPSLGATWATTEDIKLRARYSKGFRAPSLSALYGPETFSAEYATDYATCNDAGTAPADCPERQYDTYYSTNPDLGAETSTNTSLGINWQFVENWNVDMALWSIEVKDVISLRGPQDLFYAQASGAALDDPNEPNYIDRAGGTVVYASYDNKGYLKATGLDINLNGDIETDAGTFKPFLLLTKISSYEVDAYLDGPVQDLNGFNLQPEIKANLGVNWMMGPHAVDFTLEYTGSSSDDDLVADDGSGLLVKSGTDLDTYQIMNVGYSYDAGDFGKVKIGVNNLTDEDPILSSSGTYDGDYPDLYDNTGRLVYVEYTVEF